MEFYYRDKDRHKTRFGSNQSVKKSVKMLYGEKVPESAVNKCIQLCRELKDGDIVVIVDNGRIAFASVGEYFEDSSSRCNVESYIELNKRIEKGDIFAADAECPYIKRRKISVIRVLERGDTVNPYLQSAILRNRHGLSRLNEHAEQVLSGCFDAFVFNNKLTVTFRVKQKGAVNVLDLANFVLPAARLLSEDKPETVRVKTALHSPGDVILQIEGFVRECAVPLLICYLIMFGGKVGNYEFHSVIGFIKQLLNRKRKHEKKKQELELEKEAVEIELKRQEVIEKELANIEKMRELELSTVDECAKPLADSSQHLEIQPSEATPEDIRRFIEVRKKQIRG